MKYVVSIVASVVAIALFYYCFQRISPTVDIETLNFCKENVLFSEIKGINNIVDIRITPENIKNYYFVSPLFPSGVKSEILRQNLMKISMSYSKEHGEIRMENAMRFCNYSRKGKSFLGYSSLFGGYTPIRLEDEQIRVSCALNLVENIIYGFVNTTEKNTVVYIVYFSYESEPEVRKLYSDISKKAIDISQINELKNNGMLLRFKFTGDSFPGTISGGNLSILVEKQE